MSTSKTVSYNYSRVQYGWLSTRDYEHTLQSRSQTGYMPLLSFASMFKQSIIQKQLKSLWHCIKLHRMLESYWIRPTKLRRKKTRDNDNLSITYVLSWFPCKVMMMTVKTQQIFRKSTYLYWTKIMHLSLSSNIMNSLHHNNRTVTKLLHILQGIHNASFTKTITYISDEGSHMQRESSEHLKTLSGVLTERSSGFNYNWCS